MATLTRPKLASRPATSPTLTSSVPTPFPREQLQRLHGEPTSEGPGSEQQIQAGSSHASKAETGQKENSEGVLHELLPSIAYVQRSCLMTLNNLLSTPTKWNSIVPDRRHSVPPNLQSSTIPRADDDTLSPVLHKLVSNLRNRDTPEEMSEHHQPSSDTELFLELRARVEDISLSLEPTDALLVDALVSLLSHFNRLSVIHADSSHHGSRTVDSGSWTNGESSGPTDLFDTLKRQLSDLQVVRLASQHKIVPPGASPVLTVEVALLWTKIDQDLERVVAICKERTENLPQFSMEYPPQYDLEDHYDTPPEYELGARNFMDNTKCRNTIHSPISAGRQQDEKMRLDLEAVMMAIDRLYLVAPQLHNQRVELKSSKLAQMEKARRNGKHVSSSGSVSRENTSRGKQKERDVKELEDLFDLLGKASERSFKDQSFFLDGGMQSRLEQARVRGEAQREAFVEQLAEHSDAGRLHSQDAVLQPRTRDPNALLSLPEFIRESVPLALRPRDPQALLTLPEFVKEPPPPHIDDTELDHPTITNAKTKKKSRNRSMSAPSLSWLRTSSPKSSGTSNTSQTTFHSKSRSRGLNSNCFDVNYVAENHENLQHILVFFTVTGATTGVDIEAEVLPPFRDNHSEGGDRLIVKSGPQVSLPLILPGRTSAGKKVVRVQSGHYEVKLTTVSPFTISPLSTEEPLPLLDASQLALARPTSFICASCSLPLVQSVKIEEYKDLPSEHWEELVESWMCHTDQKLHEQIAKHGQTGFWPNPGQALVGGSYILFEESSMTKNNLHLAEQSKRGEDCHLVRCICGSVIGRCLERRTEREMLPVYRLLKYAIRPVSLTSEPLKIPLSAFIVEDMADLVRAHATYRFVILDEEDERPRILIWLFKPSIRLAYATSTPYAIPKSASIHAAKVLYKLLGPSEQSVDLRTVLNKYPGFPQAEYLYYPMPICRRLAGLLAQSNSAYPGNMRVMTGLQVGWLRRA